VGGAEHGEQREQHHYDDIDTQTPQQDANSQGQLAWTEMSTPLRCYQLVRLQERQNYMRVFQIGLFRISDNRIAFELRLVATWMYVL
jgi:hypothetical protein